METKSESEVVSKILEVVRTANIQAKKLYLMTNNGCYVAAQEIINDLESTISSVLLRSNKSASSGEFRNRPRFFHGGKYAPECKLEVTVPKDGAGASLAK